MVPVLGWEVEALLGMCRSGKVRSVCDDRQACQAADDYYADAEVFRQRLARDIESKARVLSRLKTQ